MKRLMTASVAALCVAAAAVCAQEAPTGKFTGQFVSETRGGQLPVNVTLEIASVTDGKVEGKVARTVTSKLDNCAGEFVLSGTFKGGKFDLRGQGSRAPDCTMRLQLAVDGDKLTGTASGRPIELTR